MSIVLTILAAVIYTLGAYFMREAHGFARLTPALLVFALFCLGASIQMFAMAREELSGLYVLFLGIEAICAFLFGALLLGETLTWQKLAGGFVVCAGVMLLRQ